MQQGWDSNPHRTRPIGCQCITLTSRPSRLAVVVYTISTVQIASFIYFLIVTSYLDLVLCIVYPAFSSACHYQEHNRKKDECLTHHCGLLIPSHLDQMQWASTNIVINFPIITTSLWCNRLVCSLVNQKIGGSSPPRDDFSSVSQI